MKCEICGSNYQQLEGNLVCANGHTLQNTFEVADDGDAVLGGRHKKVRIPKKKTKGAQPEKFHPSVAIFIVFRALFNDAMSHFGIMSDLLYKYYTGFFSLSADACANPSKAVIHGEYVLTSQAFAALVYLSKRAEMEAAGIPYLFATFRADLLKFKLNSRISIILKKHGLRAEGWPEMLLPDTQIKIITLANHVRQITDFDVFPTRRIDQAEWHSTGVIQYDTECIKSNIRRMLSRSLGLHLAYFKDFCMALDVECSDELVHYFKKYVYTYDYRRVFVPEHAFIVFIACYFVDQGCFDGTALECRILAYLQISKPRLLDLVNEQASVLSQLVSPEILIKSRDISNSNRFSNLRKAIWIIDTFKEHAAKDS